MLTTSTLSYIQMPCAHWNCSDRELDFSCTIRRLRNPKMYCFSFASLSWSLHCRPRELSPISECFLEATPSDCKGWICPPEYKQNDHSGTLSFNLQNFHSPLWVFPKEWMSWLYNLTTTYSDLFLKGIETFWASKHIPCFAVKWVTHFTISTWAEIRKEWDFHTNFQYCYGMISLRVHMKNVWQLICLHIPSQQK